MDFAPGYSVSVADAGASDESIFVLSGIFSLIALGSVIVLVNKKNEIKINPRSTIGVKSTFRCFPEFSPVSIASAIWIVYI